MAVYDVIIIGAGMAGLACASNLKGNYLLIEKKPKPYNCIACAEWVPRTFPAPAVQTTKGMVTIYPGGEVRKEYKGKIIDRQSFQKSVLNKLTGTIHLGEYVKKIEGSQVITNQGIYSGKRIIAADGPRTVANPNHRRNFLVATNFRVKLNKPLQDTLVIFNKNIDRGYGWCFPKGDIANLGVGVSSNMKTALKYCVEFFKQRGFICGDIFERTTGLIPLAGLRDNIIEESVITIGDAGGFIDPVTGAGIAYAWDSGVQAARFLNGEIKLHAFKKSIQVSYKKFFERKVQKRKILEEEWNHNLKTAVEKSWISFSRG